MADKPCRWLKVYRNTNDNDPQMQKYGDNDISLCDHPLLLHRSPNQWPMREDGRLPTGAHLVGRNPKCQGCPCHEPQPEVVKESLTTQPDPTPDTCLWWRDEHGNWCCACSDTLPGFTPWPGTDPNGCFCPNCGKIITVRVHDKP